MQSDWQSAAYDGTDTFAAAGPMTDLRSVMSLYPEAITMLARPDSGIARSTDLPASGSTSARPPPAAAPR